MNIIHGFEHVAVILGIALGILGWIYAFLWKSECDRLSNHFDRLNERHNSLADELNQLELQNEEKKDFVLWIVVFVVWLILFCIAWALDKGEK